MRALPVRAMPWICLVGVFAGCRCGDGGTPDAGDAEAPIEAPDGATLAEDDASVPGDAGDDVELVPAGGCPFDMVRVARRFCVDRFEASLVDHHTGLPLSPYYPPSRRVALFVEKQWSAERLQVGDADARNMPLPELPLWQREKKVWNPRAVSRRGVTPHGYVSGEIAALACKNAGKRLCTEDEWRLACRGEQDRQFPYGTEHDQGKCNMHREGHPAVVLHNNASKGHLDPRLNQVSVKGRPLLRKTGATPTCVSEWEGDGIFDMVGNLDEWIDDPEGTFLGGFYSRAKKDGCDSTVRFHPIEYFDYSTGVRCCGPLLTDEPAPGPIAPEPEEPPPEEPQPMEPPSVPPQMDPPATTEPAAPQD